MSQKLVQSIRGCPCFWSNVSFLHSTTVVIDQSGGNPSGEGSKPVPVSVYVNEPYNLAAY